MYLTYTVPPADTDTVTVAMVQYAQMTGIRKPIMEQEGGRIFLHYPVEGWAPIGEVAASGSAGLARTVLLAVCDAMLSVSEFMLDPNSVLISDASIFRNAENGEIQLFCLPGLREKTEPGNPADAVRALCRKWTEGEAAIEDRLVAYVALEGLKKAEGNWKYLRYMIDRTAHSRSRPALIRSEDGQVFPLPGACQTVGRMDTPEMPGISASTSVSRKHARLEKKDNQWQLTDLSLNHTYLNGHRLDKNRPVPLHCGDILQFALVSYCFVC